MRIVDIARGLLSGYGFKLVQVLATILVVPYLLQDEVIGLDDYGRIFAILGLLSPLHLLTDGLRTSFSRSISRSLSDDELSTGQEIGNAFKIVAGLCTVLAIVLFAVRGNLLHAINIPLNADYMVGIAVAIAFVSIDSVCFLLTSYLNAKGRMDVANFTMGIEVVARSIALVLWFMVHGGSVSGYFVIFALSASIRSLGLLAYAVRKWPADFVGAWSGQLSSTREAIRYSFSLSAASVVFYVFQRLSIPLTAVAIGPAEAGLLALGINTISNNLSQVLLNVIRPLLIPIAARIRFDSLSVTRRRLLLDIDMIYVLLSGLITIPIIAGMPTLVGVWLGEEFVDLIFPAQLLVAGATFNVAFNVRRALMVGHGLAGGIARVSLACGGVGAFGLAYALWLEPSWVAVSAVIGLVSASSSLFGVGLAFDRSELVAEARAERRGLRAAVVLAFGVSVGWLASSIAPLSLEPRSLVPPMAAAAAVVISAHLLMIRIPQVYDTLAKLNASANRQIFD